MAATTKFEVIEAWQKSHELKREVYIASNMGIFTKDYGLRYQIRLADVTIMSNIAEGFERLVDLTTHINRMPAGLMRRLCSSELKGSKYK